MSVIVPVFGHEAPLARLYAALAAQDYSRDRFEIILVDNHPTPRLAPGAFPLARVFHEPVQGSFRARNRGVTEARGSLLAFTDADCIPDSGWIRTGVTHLTRTPECGLVGGKIDLAFAVAERPTAAELYERYTALRQRDYLRHERFAVTANLFTSKNVFQSVGPFRNDLLSGGDVEWGQRVHRAGYRQVFAPGALVLHPARSTVGELVRRCRRIAGGRHFLRPQVRAGWADLGRRLYVGLSQSLRHRRDFGWFRTAQVIALGAFLQVVESWERGRLRLGAVPLR